MKKYSMPCYVLTAMFYVVQASVLGFSIASFILGLFTKSFGSRAVPFYSDIKLHFCHDREFYKR